MTNIWKCAYINCSNKRVKNVPDPFHMIGIEFIKFPKPKTHPEDCLRWINASGLDLTLDKIQPDHFICTKHFINPKGPTVDNPDPLPYDGDFKHSRNKGCIYEEKRIMEVDDNFLDVVKDEEPTEDSIPLAEMFQDSMSKMNGNDNCSIIYATDFHIFPISMKEEPEDLVKESKVFAEVNSLPNNQTNNLQYPSSENLFLWEIYKEIYQMNVTDSFNWFVSKTEDLVILVKQNKSTCNTEPLSISISSTLEIKIRVYDEDLPNDHPLLKHPKTQQGITCARDVIDYLHFLGKWVICGGNTEANFLRYKRDQSGIFRPHTNALHSRICERLFRNKEKTVAKCKRCKIFRYLFLKNLRRRQEARKMASSTKSPTKFQQVKIKETNVRQENEIKEVKFQQEREMEVTKKKFKYSKPLESPEAFRYFFMQEQIRLQSNGLKRVHHWNTPIVKWCKVLNNKSHICYKMLTQALVLPSTRTLSNTPFPEEREIPWLNVSYERPLQYH